VYRGIKNLNIFGIREYSEDFPDRLKSFVTRRPGYKEENCGKIPKDIVAMTVAFPVLT
jgi:hypothetical protein